MSSIFNQITREAQKQKAMLEELTAQAVSKSDSSTPPGLVANPQIGEVAKPLHDTHSAVTALSDVATSQSDVTMAKGDQSPTTGIEKSGKHRGRSLTASDSLGKGSRIDIDKLKTIIEELSVLQTNAFGFSVRMSKREKEDIEEFILDTLRREGLRGYEVSIAKLMRYSMRYMFRVHPQEFVTALRAALQVEESLSI